MTYIIATAFIERVLDPLVSWIGTVTALIELYYVDPLVSNISVLHCSYCSGQWFDLSLLIIHSCTLQLSEWRSLWGYHLSPVSWQCMHFACHLLLEQAVASNMHSNSPSYTHCCHVGVCGALALLSGHILGVVLVSVHCVLQLCYYFQSDTYVYACMYMFCASMDLHNL